MLKEKLTEFENIYIYLERNIDHPYEDIGRMQNEKEAMEIDILMKDLLDELGLDYLSVISSRGSIEDILSYLKRTC